jgi:hypothetical protein
VLLIQNDLFSNLYPVLPLISDSDWVRHYFKKNIYCPSYLYCPEKFLYAVKKIKILIKSLNARYGTYLQLEKIHFFRIWSTTLQSAKFFCLLTNLCGPVLHSGIKNGKTVDQLFLYKIGINSNKVKPVLQESNSSNVHDIPIGKSASITRKLIQYWLF